jgi:hypothetical protein
MTEPEVRALLAGFDGVGGLEAWIAGRRWKAVPGGWTVTGELEGYAFRVEVVSVGLQIFANASDVSPAVWQVPAGEDEDGLSEQHAAGHLVQDLRARGYVSCHGW